MNTDLAKRAVAFADAQIKLHNPNYDPSRWSGRSLQYKLESVYALTSLSTAAGVEAERWLTLFYATNPAANKCWVYKCMEADGLLPKVPLAV